VDIAVYEDGASAVVSTLAVLGACDGVINRLLRTRSSQLLPEARDHVSEPTSDVGTGGQVDVVAERAPELGSNVTQQVVTCSGIRNDVVHGGSESLEQESVSGAVLAEQTCAAVSRSEFQNGCLEVELSPMARNPDLES